MAAPRAAGAVHPSRLGLVPGTSTRTDQPEFAPTAKGGERVEGQVEAGLVSPVSMDDSEQAELVGGGDQLVDPDVLVDLAPVITTSPHDEKLEECPPMADLKSWVGKRKQAETPEDGEVVEEARVERPIVAKKAKRQLR